MRSSFYLTSEIRHGQRQGSLKELLHASYVANNHQASLDKIVLEPQLTDLLAIVKGARNGFTYGAKIRFPHALVYVNTGLREQCFGC